MECISNVSGFGFLIFNLCESSKLLILMASSSCQHIILTGSPGIGKTTLIGKICEVLERKGVPVKGFYTEECRENGVRIGFDVVTLSGQRSPLARVGDAGVRSSCHVGKYTVNVQSFEQAALPIFSAEAGEPSPVTPVYVIDEIGKMEIFSTSFKQAVTRLLNDKSSTVLATLPVKSANPIPFVEEIRRHRAARLYEVTRANRDALLDEIIKSVESARLRKSI